MTGPLPRRHLAALVASLAIAGCDQDAGPTIAAASSFRPIRRLLEPLIAPVWDGVDAATPAWVFGASGTLANQLVAGLPASLFLAADQATADRVAATRPGAGSPIVFAHGRLAWWPRPPRDRTETIAIANPRVAPYGAAAAEVLLQFPNHPTVQTATVSDVAVAIDRGRAAVGIVSGSIASSLASTRPIAIGWIDPADHSPLPQCAVGLSAAITRSAAMVLLDSPVQRCLRSAGYLGPES